MMLENNTHLLSIESDDDDESLSDLLREVVNDMFTDEVDGIFDDEFGQKEDGTSEISKITTKVGHHQYQNIVPTRSSKRTSMSSAGESALTTSFQDEICKYTGSVHQDCNPTSVIHQEDFQSRSSSNSILIKPTSYESNVSPRTIRRMPHRPNHRNVDLNDSIVGILRPHLRYSKTGSSTSIRKSLSKYLRGKIIMPTNKTKIVDSFTNSNNDDDDVKSSIRTASTMDESTAMNDSWYSLLENDNADGSNADDDWMAMKCVEFRATMEVFTFVIEWK